MLELDGIENTFKYNCLTPLH